VWNRTAGKDPAASPPPGQESQQLPAARRSVGNRHHHPHQRRRDRRRVSRGDGLLSGDVSGKLFVEMSTVAPETSARSPEKNPGAARR